MSRSAHAAAFAPPKDASGRPSLIGLDREGMATAVREMDQPAFRAKQLWHWVYRHGARSFEEMTTLSKDFRAKLEETHSLVRPEISSGQTSFDGTKKWLLRFPDRQEVESVFIPEEDRGTLCISSQVGCTLTCKFCHTGTQRLVRNLGPGEVLGQVMMARDDLGEWPAPKEGRLLTNIVLMGMGEPLYNYENVAKAVRILLDQEGLGFSRRRITLSTAGVVPQMKRCGEELGVNLAVSLHAVRDELRDHIVPINRKYPIAELLDACRNYPGIHNARRITFEYVMLKDVNDSDADAKELARLLADIPSKVNLIPFNPWPGAEFECSTPERIDRFSQILFEAGMSAPVRTPRGQDIMAACGQLKSASQRLKKAEREKAATAGANAEAAQA